MLCMEGPRERLIFGRSTVQGLLDRASVVLNIVQFRATYEDLTF